MDCVANSAQESSVPYVVNSFPRTNRLREDQRIFIISVSFWLQIYTLILWGGGMHMHAHNGFFHTWQKAMSTVGAK